ncbi:PAS domain-containing protein, partial [Acinetobacter baumannii]|uniref:PAS domain-containing protein n=1 Tax=Acinetobacter baumannii TaxID=470 RepID=UPI000B164B49
AYCRLVGEREIIGKPVRDALPEVERQGFIEILDYSPVFDEQAQPAGVIAMVVETTERVLAERELQGQQARLQQMFEQAPGMMAMLRGPEHVFEMVNPAYCRLVGEREIIGKPVRDALPEVERQGFIEILD